MKSVLGLNISLENPLGAIQKRQEFKFQASCFKFPKGNFNTWMQGMHAYNTGRFKHKMWSGWVLFTMCWPMDLSVTLRVGHARRVDARGLCLFRWTGREICGRILDDLCVAHWVYLNCYSTNSMEKNPTWECCILAICCTITSLLSLTLSSY
jgi:hypothetical protein